MSRFDPIIELTDCYINHSSRRIVEEQEQGWVSVLEQQEEHADVYEDQEPTNKEIQEVLAQYAQDQGIPSEFSLPMTLALMIVLRRMVFSACLVDLSLLFGKRKSTLSVIFNEMIEKIYIKFYPALKFDYSPAMYCVGFIDGTFSKIARPIQGHGLKYQAVVTLNSITSFIMKPDSGRNHDVCMYHKSQLDVMLCVAFDFTNINSPCYYLYGDLTYTVSDHIMIPFRRQMADEQELAINKKHKFAHVGSLWAFLKYSQTQRSGQSPVGLYYIVGTFLKNLHVY
ncbi:hypothetical protein PHYBLDRAFT_152798 [Phycomyces blakesleeanus NRRL 1555(-)]|uniref:DDE Tnp4 domain-containing protein n=1 Tax=Phycomyces blakesleeanus (strain ATCC 8743b / DSM 1359 / FGSC 10004 / NBRC 33097 / NRRL 1555) TaxID=763407 RepID=A0A162WC99_PHYB8|nr:hypothetical protein PHYBLDRAFT_152798 [Phycomyces blakesleeanus NRRL 1555(-)]OAD66225.1 hypothetical protein PHYBLDRAFT_152798 [Phycomyces blakesleeanus NRRL 1555(-)]|eukprot:XP_018284265.1 hypothetical protein PHYBLDRAFT_152798 [Phycomyces blakesleeanus NRRL 1555(-)]